MKLKESIATQSGWPLAVETRATTDRLELVFESPLPKRCLLHWGVRRAAAKEWEIPPAACWPADTKAAGKNAVQSPFLKPAEGSQLVIRLTQQSDFKSLDFVLYFPDEKRWDNNHGRDYHIQLAEPRQSQAPAPEPPPAQPQPATVALLDTLHAQIGDCKVTFERTFQIQGQGELAALVSQNGDQCRLSLLSNIPGNLLLHWGIARNSPREWLLPPESMRSPETVLWQEHTAQTPFSGSIALQY